MVAFLNHNWRQFYISAVCVDRVSVFGSVLTDVPPLRQGVMHVLRWPIVTKTLRCYLCPEKYQNCSLIVSDTHK